MKVHRFVISGRFTLLLTALLSGLYLFQTFGNDNPWTGMLSLMRVNLPVRMLIVLTAVHFLAKGIEAVRSGRMRRAPSAIFFISLFAVILGTLISVDTRAAGKERVTASNTLANGITAVDVRIGIADTVLVIGEQSDMRITNAEAVIADGGMNKTLRPYPFARTSEGFAYINDAGISPALEIASSGKRTTVSTLSVLPPGRIVSVPLARGAAVDISLVPEREFAKGRLKGRQYNLRDPRYRVTVKKGQAVVFSGILCEGRTVTYGGAEVTARRTGQWVEIVTVRDKAVLVIYIGLFGVLAGILLHPVEIIARQRRRNQS